MTDFEKWLQTTPEYKTLVFQHGERLLIQRDGEYVILPVRLAYMAWISSRQRNKDKYIAITQDWYTKGRNSILECDHVIERTVFSRTQRCSKCGLELGY